MPIYDVHKCLRCAHLWHGRKSTPPRHCPKCNSKYWHLPVVRVSVSKASKRPSPRKGVREAPPSKTARVPTYALPLLPLLRGVPKSKWSLVLRAAKALLSEVVNS